MTKIILSLGMALFGANLLLASASHQAQNSELNRFQCFATYKSQRSQGKSNTKSTVHVYNYPPTNTMLEAKNKVLTLIDGKAQARFLFCRQIQEGDEVYAHRL
jgi:hypothetical protein